MRNCSINPIKNPIFHGVLTALFLSGSIYLEHFEITLCFLNTFLGIIALWLWLQGDRKAQFFIGFFTGILWFYWIGFSFRFTELPFLTYVAAPLSGVVLGIIFYFVFYINNIFLRALLIWIAFDIIEPFGFEWFKPELIFVNSYIGTGLWQFLAIILAVLAFIKADDSRLKAIAVLPLLLMALHINSEKIKEPDLKIKLAQLEIDQNKKWKPKYKKGYVLDAVKKIKEAKKEGYDMIILPETSMPITLNLDKPLLRLLRNLSSNIAIVVGALKLEKRQMYNSTYIFHKGNLTVADKVFLVPFGETIPLPKWMGGWINDLFFEGANDFETAEKPTDFQIGSEVFRNGICFEGTKKEMFKNMGSYMVVTSNNAWFAPSIEPTMQKLVMKLYGERYGVKIFHSSNMSRSEVIN